MSCMSFLCVDACKHKIRHDKIIADGLYKDGNYPLALTYYIKGMEIAEKEDDKRTYMACIGNIANIYEAFGDYEANLFYLLKGYKMSKSLMTKS